jgi:hypothetical protein
LLVFEREVSNLNEPICWRTDERPASDSSSIHGRNIPDPRDDKSHTTIKIGGGSAVRRQRVWHLFQGLGRDAVLIALD